MLARRVGPDTTNGLPLVASRSFPYAYGINDAGQIVGSYNGSDGTHGFLYSGGIYTQLDDPLANPINGTSAFGINATGQIVGYYYANGLYHGFLYSGGIYTTLDDPLGTVCTEALGINNLGQIVGEYADTDINGIPAFHGFLATPAAAPSVRSITASTDNGATDLNAGHVVAVSLNLDETVYVTGTPFLLLNDNEVATYATGSGTHSLTFTYMQPGDNIPNLQVTGLNLNGGTIQDGSAGTALSGLVQGDLSSPTRRVFISY